MFREAYKTHTYVFVCMTLIWIGGGSRKIRPETEIGFYSTKHKKLSHNSFEGSFYWMYDVEYISLIVID